MSVTTQTMKILHVSPTFYAPDSVIGGGEKHVIYICRALNEAAKILNIKISTSILSFGEIEQTQKSSKDIPFKIIYGKPWDIHSIDTHSLIEQIKEADVVHVHQCLSAVGFFVAAHSRLLGKRVIGSDQGCAEYPLASQIPDVGLIYDFFHAYSEYCIQSFGNLTGPVELIKGPIDTNLYKPTTYKRNSNLVLALGRLLPHKGFDRIVKALPKELQLKIIGFNYDIDYKNFLLSLCPEKDIQILDGIDDKTVLSYIQSAGLFVHASVFKDYRGKFYTKPELLGLAPLEGLSTGLTTLVSDAGALVELAAIPGCYLFRNDQELESLLIDFRDKKLKTFTPEIMHNAVIDSYGLAQFGTKMLSLLTR